jgi:hypothetical protein
MKPRRRQALIPLTFHDTNRTAGPPHALVTFLIRRMGGFNLLERLTGL